MDSDHKPDFGSQTCPYMQTQFNEAKKTMMYCQDDDNTVAKRNNKITSYDEILNERPGIDKIKDLTVENNKHRTLTNVV